MVSILHPRQRALPRSLTHPAGIVFLDPAHRVSREELDRQDARWRAMRERAYARAWSEDATLVGSVRRFSARSALLNDWEERTIGRQFGRGGGSILYEDGASTVHSNRTTLAGRNPPTSSNDWLAAKQRQNLYNVYPFLLRLLRIGRRRRRRRRRRRIRPGEQTTTNGGDPNSDVIMFKTINETAFKSRWFEQGKAVAAMGTLTLAILMTVTPHFFLDMLLIASYGEAQASFQRLYLVIHFVCCIFSFIIVIYSFWGINAHTYHAFCNMRSWSLLIGLFMFFSGFFAILGFALDWHKFRDRCVQEVDLGPEVQEVRRCREIWDALLTSCCVLWAITEASYCCLVIVIDRYRRSHFAEQEQQKEEKEKLELLERYQNLGMKDDEAIEKVEEGYAQSMRSLEHEQEEVFAEMGRMVRTDQWSKRRENQAPRKPTRSATISFMPRRAMTFFMPKVSENERRKPAAHVMTASPSAIQADDVLVLKEKNAAAMCESPEILIAPPTPNGWQRAEADADEIKVVESKTPPTTNNATSSMSPTEYNQLLPSIRPNIPTLTVETPNGSSHALRPPAPRRKQAKRSMTTR